MAALFRGIVYHYQTEMHSMGRKTIAQRSATITRLETTRGANCSNLSFFLCHGKNKPINANIWFPNQCFDELVVDMGHFTL